MEKRARIILYGDSLILAGLQASLSGVPDLDIVTLQEHAAELEMLVAELQPAAVIFSLGSIPPDFLQAFCQQPGLLLIGVDPSSAQCLVLSSRTQPALSTADLVGALH